MKEVEYLKTLFQIKRNLCAHLLDQMNRDFPSEEELKKAELAGRLEAFNQVLDEIETFEATVFDLVAKKMGVQNEVKSNS